MAYDLVTGLGNKIMAVAGKKDASGFVQNEEIGSSTASQPSANRLAISPSMRHLLGIAAEFLAVTAVLVGVFFWKAPFIAQRIVPVVDGGSYLTLARNLLLGEPLYEWFRPLLFSGIVAGVWSITGENYLFVRYFNLVFTLASVGALYYAVRMEKGRTSAFAAMFFYVTALQILIWSDHILVHGLTTLFAVLTLIAFTKYDARRWFIGGVFATLAVLARYPSVVIVVPIIFAFALERRNIRLTVIAIAGSLVPLVLFQAFFPFVLPKLPSFFLSEPSTGMPWYYYLANWYFFFGIIGFFALVALFLPSTYKSIGSRPWALWLLASLLFFTITPNKQDRFTFEWTPAVAFLSVVGFQAIISRTKSVMTRAHEAQMNIRQMNTRLRWKHLAIGVLFAGLLVLQMGGSIRAYLPIQRGMAMSRDNNLIIVANYIKQNTNSDSRFISDYLAGDLTYFTLRNFSGLYRRTSDVGFLDYLYKFVRSERADYVVIFAKVWGNSPSVLENSGFLTLVTVIHANTLGDVYIFRYTGS